jgi:hypothetical protein
MATNTTKGNGQSAAPKGGAPSSVNAISATEDRKLANFVRENAQPLIAVVLAAAATAGENRDYPKMHEWRRLGTQLTDLCGVSRKGSASEPATAMAASASA